MVKTGEFAVKTLEFAVKTGEFAVKMVDRLVKAGEIAVKRMVSLLARCWFNYGQFMVDKLVL